jgi:hypothetical protein
VVTFSFENESPKIDIALKVVRDNIFEEPKFEIIPTYQNQKRQTIRQLLHCYHVTKEDDPAEENPCNIQIPEVEGEREVEGTKIDLEYYVAPLKIRKVNIGTVENPKIASIGDYWDNEIIERIIELLREYSDFFPVTFSKMKVLAGELGEMKISFNPKSIPIRQRPYRLNLVYKKKLKEEIDKMLEVGVIEPMEESKWISPMVVQEKKQVGIGICVYLRKLNDACLHDPFPTPFIEEFLENVGGQEDYSFTDGFLGYHHIRIALEDRHKTTFSKKWGTFQYMVIPFGLKNVPTVFSRVVVAAFKDFIHNLLEVYLDD